MTPLLDQFTTPTPIQRLEGFCEGYEVYMKRDDLIHPIISGNKWRKLKYNIKSAISNNKSQLVTKGGAYSNHIAAVATTGKLNGLKTVGIIRGERPATFGFTLRMAEKMGMDFHFISRNVYPDWKMTPDFENFNSSYFVPEGGTNELAITGCSELVDEIGAEMKLDELTICLAAGTGGTTSGILKSCPASTKVIAFSALKGVWLKDDIQRIVGKYCENLTLTDEYCFGGYAKSDVRLIDFVNDFYVKYGIPLDPVYTGKMMFGLREMCNKGLISKENKILVIHTGGLQGGFGFAESGIGIDWVNDINCEEANSIRIFS